ncbi:Na(+)-translocating NADH-quinone reductase subunit A [Fulvitalea axinellae]|uniref:Na(+)-translocating NADH-quinone reductase subunit A n=1 Tax=Fulvitalea axinellae TaxID=1182444 RepID=A0AAU9CP01_9BACT|nr:Na(+)-translocating NADH-quinone reductase subunit A [Fulvitalea axinellae]
MSKTIKLKRGFDINLAGKADKKIASCPQPEVFAVKPLDFVGMQRPKVTVKVGETVKAGTPVLFDKKLETVMYTAPVSGEVVEIKRGLKRRVEEIKILADKEFAYEEFKAYGAGDIAGISREEAQEQLTKSGVWPQIIQRPYGIVANPADTPRDIFVSGFDSAPLAADYDFTLEGEEKYLQAGFDILAKFSGKAVKLGLKSGNDKVFKGLNNVEATYFDGVHPAGNVGTHIHKVAPINKGEVVWTVNPYGVAQIGKLFIEGKYDASKVIAVAGSEIKAPQHYKTFSGACINKFIENNMEQTNVRYISGNVLTGTRVEDKGFLGYYDSLFTVIPEGNEHELFGWALPTTSKLSFQRALGLFSWINRNKEYTLNTNTRGEARAFVQSGVLEKMVPMDLYPTYLLKSILAQDFENMEALGIYEVIEEDLALCEFVDVSKHKIQAILRQGLDLLQYS